MSSAWVRCVAAGLVAGLTAAGCSALPNDGPLASEIESKAITSEGLAYTVIDVNTEVAAILASAATFGFRENFGGSAPKSGDSIGIGDVLAIAIFEAGPDGLFSTIERKQTDVRATVDSSGKISVPYAGRIDVAGRTATEVRAEIIEALKERALEPDVTVELLTNNSRTVTVGGAVGSPQKVPLGLNGERVLDVIALAGGSRAPAHETYVSLSRGSEEERVLLQTLVDDPAQNVYVRPGDRIFLIQDAQTFTAFGAVTTTGRVPFGEERLSLIEGAALAGGMSDSRADPTGLFLFRYEDPDLVYQIRPGAVAAATGAPASPKGGPNPSGDMPVVYRFDLREPSSYLIAQNFPMRDKDVIYVAHHPSAELAKFLALIGGLRVGTAIAGDVL